MTTHRIILFTLSITITAGAGCKKDDGGSKTGGSSAKPAESAPVDLAAINGAAPTDLGLVFESRSIEDEIQAVVPVGWEAGRVFPGNLTPPSGSKLGFFTRFKVGSNCDGACEPKDWAPIIQKVELDPVTGDGAEILKSEESDGHRLVVSRTDDRLYVVAVWSKPGASRYFYCRAELDDGAQSAADAFEQACRAMRVTQW